MPRDFQEAAQRLTDPAACQQVAFRNGAVKVFPEGVHPEVWRFALGLKREFAARRYPLIVASIRRSHAEQAILFELGQTRFLPGESVHHTGYCLDLAHFRHGRALCPYSWAVIGAIGKEVARRQGEHVVWGPELVGFGEFGPWHFELRDWRPTVRRLRQADAQRRPSGVAAEREPLPVFRTRRRSDGAPA